jgi:carbon-monoxide dehydrogenase large subunit
MGTYGSRSISVGGTALVKAAAKVRNKVKKIAAHQLEASESDLEFNQEDGTVSVRGAPDKSMAFGTLAFAAYTAHNLPDDIEPGLEETAFYDPSNFTFPNSAHLALVEVSRDTGEVTIHRYVAVDDVGKVINPLIVDGQITGGIVQGIGQALYENAVYDPNGQLLSGSMMDYTVPRASMFPMFETARQETPSPTNPLGVKGAGEMGTIAATVTVANAVMDALAPYGVEHMDMPLTAPKLWHAINS